MKQLIITGPERILDAIKSLVEAMWEADHKYESMDALDAQIEEAAAAIVESK